MFSRPHLVRAVALAALVATADAAQHDPSKLVERAEELVRTDPEEAGRLIARALPSVPGAEHAEVRARAFLVDALRLEALGQDEEARRRVEDGLVVARREHLPEVHAFGLTVGARLERRAGRTAEALELLRELEALPERVRTPEALSDLARLAAEQGRPALCLEHAAAACRTFERRGDWRSGAELHVLVGRCLLELGDVAHARGVLLETARAYELELSSFEARPVDEATLHLLLSKAARLQADPTAARHHLQLAEELAAAFERPDVDEHVARERAALALSEGRPAEALDELRPLLSKLDARPPAHVARIRTLQGRALLAAGRFADAEPIRAEVAAGLEAMPWLDERVHALRLLADLANARGDRAEAVARLLALDDERTRADRAAGVGSFARRDERARAVATTETRLAAAEEEFDRTRSDLQANLTTTLALLGFVALALGGFALWSRRRTKALDRTVRESLTRQLDAESTLAYISHDLRTPLTTIRAASELLALELPADQRRLVRLIESGSHRMEEILESMLALVQYKSLPSGEPMHERFDVGALVQDVADEARRLADEKRIELLVRRPGAAVTLSTEPVLFRQIVQNLVSNAIKYSPPGEAVEVRVEAQDGGAVRLIVEDRGPGIPVEDREHLWALFGRTSAVPTAGESSTGVGLALAKSIADALGCAIEVDGGRHGRGAVFRLDLTPLRADGASREFVLPRPPEPASDRESRARAR